MRAALAAPRGLAVLLWLLGVLAVGAVAYGLRLVMGWVGLTL